jgi:hypothetical protein
MHQCSSVVSCWVFARQAAAMVPVAAQHDVQTVTLARGKKLLPAVQIKVEYACGYTTHQPARGYCHLSLASAASCLRSGVSSSEQDVPRFLHMRPSFVHHSTSSSTAAAALRRRRLTAASARSATAGKAAAASPATHLAGHWHTSSSFRPSQYDTWGNSIGDQQCASNDKQLADAAGAEVLPWGIKAIGATNDTLLKAQQRGRAIVCIIDSGLAKDHAEYRNYPGQLSSCQAGANCPYDWSKDIVGHGTHVAGGSAAAACCCSATQTHRLCVAKVVLFQPSSNPL